MKKFIQTFVIVAIGIVLGNYLIGFIVTRLLGGNVNFSVEQLLSTVQFAVVAGAGGVLTEKPIFYSKKEISIFQMFFRYVAHYFSVVLIVFVYGFFIWGLSPTVESFMWVVVNSAFVYGVVCLLLYLNDVRVARKINEKLEEARKR